MHLEGTIHKWPAVTSVGLLLLAAAFSRWPPVFVLMVQIVVSVSAVYVLVNASQVGLTRWPWTMAVVALVFNPIVPAPLPFPAWRLVALGTAAVFALWLTLVQGWPRMRDIVSSAPFRRR